MIDLKTSTVESLLGVLSLKPMSGYEMRQFMSTSTANFWSESFGQIYPALKRMVAEGLVTVEELGADGHPAKKVYRITDAGLARLTAWIGVPARPQVPRNELLLKIFFGDRAEQGAIRAQIEQTRRLYVGELERYEPMQAQMEQHFAGHPGMPYWRMTLRYGLAEARAYVAWCDETLVELERLGIRD